MSLFKEIITIVSSLTAASCLQCTDERLHNNDITVCGTVTIISGNKKQCDFRFDLFFSFSFRFKNIFAF